MSLVCNAINTAWMLNCRRELRRFRKASRDVHTTQIGLLLDTLVSNENSRIGQDFEFSTIKDYNTFASRVPVSTFDDYQESVDRICRGENHVLTEEPVLLLEPTSGSTNARKLIPYTRSLQIQIQRAVSVWIGDLFWNRPNVRKGAAYWSISPGFASEEKTAGGIKVGFADDTEYLGRMERLGMRHVLAVSPDVSQIQSLEAFRQETLIQLLLAQDLALISVWSPTFLTTLISLLLANVDQIGSGLRARNLRRAYQVTEILNSELSIPDKLKQLWPSLALISCWTDGSAGAYLADLTDLFPGVEIQPKGLLATEAFVSIPLVGRRGAALAIRSHFFEFSEIGNEERVVLAHSLELGKRYLPMVTTAGGLYRYKTNDIVEVVGFEEQTPLIRFIGRDRFVDLVGEKLDEGFVNLAISKALCESSSHGEGQKKTLAMLVPILGPPASYRLLVESTSRALELNSIADSLRTSFNQNPHFQYASRIGQLSEIQVLQLNARSQSLWSLYESSSLASGMRVGDIKPTSLCTNLDVAKRMMATFTEQTITG